MKGKAEQTLTNLFFLSFFLSCILSDNHPDSNRSCYVCSTSKIHIILFLPFDFINHWATLPICFRLSKRGITERERFFLLIVQTFTRQRTISSSLTCLSPAKIECITLALGKRVLPYDAPISVVLSSNLSSCLYKFLKKFQLNSLHADQLSTTWRGRQRGSCKSIV